MGLNYRLLNAISGQNNGECGGTAFVHCLLSVAPQRVDRMLKLGLNNS